MKNIMNNDVRIITDPLGNNIYLPHECGVITNDDCNEKYDDASAVIMKPAMLFRVEDDTTETLFYFRSVGCHKTMLIVVKYQDCKWKSTQCMINPSNEILSEIM